MRRLKRLIAMLLAAASLSACTMPVVRTLKQDDKEKPSPLITHGPLGEEDGATDPQTAASGAVTKYPAIPRATSTKPASTKKHKATKVQAAKTKPAKTKPVATKPVTTNPVKQEKGNPIPDHLKALLDKPGTGMILLYTPEGRKGIRTAVNWDVRSYDSGTDLILITKKKGSNVKVMRSQLSENEKESLPGETIRLHTTKSDYEAIRIRYSDPETMAFNFIQVTDPNGKHSITPIKSSMMEIDKIERVSYKKD